MTNDRTQTEEQDRAWPVEVRWDLGDAACAGRRRCGSAMRRGLDGCISGAVCYAGRGRGVCREDAAGRAGPDV